MWQTIRTPFLTILFVFIGLFLFIKLNGPIPFSVTSVTTTKENLFTVQGTGEVTSVPDTALISLGVDKTANTVQDAQTQVNQIINKVTSDLKSLGVDEKKIKTTNYSVNPNYDYNGGDQKITGYDVAAQIEVRVQPIDKANQAVDIATKDGANTVGDMQFVVDETKQKQLEDQARKQAIDEAKTKAESISRASGIRLGRLIDVQEDNTTPVVQPMALNTVAFDANAAQKAAPPTQLNPGENKITSNVTLSYETY